MKQNKAIILRGAPASGKGTLTKLFVEKLDGKVALLELDTFRWGFHLVNREISEITKEEHQLAYENFLSVLENYCKNGIHTLVIEGLFSWDREGIHGNMQDLIGIFNKYNIDYKSLVLYAKKEILWERNLKRKYSVPKDEFEDLYNYVMSEFGEEEVKIDVGSSTPENSVNTILYNLKQP